MILSDEQAFQINATQHRHDIHPFTCGNDSRHRPLIATRFNMRCADCDYTQEHSAITISAACLEQSIKEPATGD